jgi:predicted RNA binding protein YcfA (HicA-like mRNA interferase family)
MPSHSALPGEIKRHKLIKALKQLGFEIDTRGGDGSYYKITWPRTQKSITVPFRLPKQVLAYILKEIEIISGLTWEEIKNIL